MSNAEAVEQVHEILASGERDMAKIAEEMVDISLNKGTLHKHMDKT